MIKLSFAAWKTKAGLLLVAIGNKGNFSIQTVIINLPQCFSYSVLVAFAIDPQVICRKNCSQRGKSAINLQHKLRCCKLKKNCTIGQFPCKNFHSLWARFVQMLFILLLLCFATDLISTNLDLLTKICKSATCEILIRSWHRPITSR